MDRNREDREPQHKDADELQGKLDTAYARVREARLPGWDSHMDAHPTTTDWMNSQREKVDRAIRDEDEVLFLRSLGGWEKGWGKINTALAEVYRSENTDPASWELRYIKWMKIKFIKFECPLGTFYLVPQPPARSPRAKHWFTVDEMIDILQGSTTLATINAFGQLPARASSLGKPEAGEKHLVVNTTDDGNPAIYYKFRGGVHGGKRLR